MTFKFDSEKDLGVRALHHGETNSGTIPVPNLSRGSKESTQPLKLVHMDVCRPMPVASKGGSRYLATFLDDYSKLSVR